MSSQSVSAYLERTIKQAIDHNKALWIARRDERTVLISRDWFVDLSSVAEAEVYGAPHLPTQGLAGTEAFQGTVKAMAYASMTAESVWRTMDAWRQEQPVWKLYWTGLFEQIGPDEDRHGNPAKLAMVLAASRSSDGLLRRVLINRQFIHLMMSDVRDLEYCEMDMLADGQVRIYSLTDDHLLLGMVMPIAIQHAPLGTLDDACPRCAGTGTKTPDYLTIDRNEGNAKDAPMAMPTALEEVKA